MTPQPIKRQSIIPRIDGIQRDIMKLRALADLPEDVFAQDEHFDLAQFYLRRALEGVFHIGSHILARLPGGRATEYKDIAKKLGEMKIVDPDFANAVLSKMAGYRNRLTHFYADIKPSELHNLLKHHLTDIEQYLGYIKTVLEQPRRFNLTIE